MHKGRVKVLLVEDDEDDYIITRDLLSEIEGTWFDLEWVDTYETALEVIKRSEHDVYLFDYRLGRRNGLELLREVQALGCVAPAIFLTGQKDYAVDVEAMQAGAADYLVKGQIDAPLLERVIRYARERSQTLEALRQSEDRYRAIVEDQSELICRFLPDRTLTFVNQAYCRYFNKQRSELIGHHFVPLIPEEEREQAEKYLASLSRENPVGTIEYRIVMPPGETRWLFWSTRAIFNQSGDLVEFQSVGQDISDRKAFEEMLRNVAEGVSATTGEAFCRSLVQYLVRTLKVDYAFIGEVSLENNQIVKTTAVCDRGEIVDNFEYDLTNTPCEKIIGKQLCCYPSGVQQEFPHDRLLVEMGVESYIGTPLFDSARNALGLLVVMDSKPLINPTTAVSLLQIFGVRASAELERQRSVAALKKSEQQYRTLAANFPNGGVFLFDRDLRYTIADGAGLEPVGLSKKLLEGKTIWEVLPPETCEIVEPIYRAALAGEISTNEMRYADHIYLEQTLPVRNEGGEILAGMVVSEDITERKAFEEALHRREQEFKALVENAPDIISRFDRELRYVYVNPAIEKATGMPSSAFRGKTVQEVGMPNELVSQWSGILRNVFETGFEGAIEFDFPTPSGLRYYQSRAVPEFEPDGSVGSILVISRDITDRKQVEEALQQANEGLGIAVEERTIELREAIARKEQEIILRQQIEESLRQSEAKNIAILNAIPDMMFRLGSDGTCLDFVAAPRSSDLLLPLSEFLGKKMSSMLPKEVAEQAMHCVEQALSTGEVQIFEYRLAMNGVQRDREARMVVCGEDQVLCLVRDISDRKAVESALRESEQRFRATFESAAVGIAHIALDGRLLRVNQRFCDIVGYSHSELLNSTFEDITHPDDLKASLAHVQALLASSIQMFSLEKRYRRKDGSPVWTQVTVSLVRSPERTTRIRNTDTRINQSVSGTQSPESLGDSSVGEAKYFIVVIEDISDRKLAEAEQQRLAAQIEQQARTLDEILSASPDCFYLFDRSGKYTYVSKNGARVLGLEQTDFIGSTWRDLGLSPDIMELLDAQREAVFATGQPLSDEISYRTANGVTHYEYILSPIHGKVSYIPLSELPILESEVQKADGSVEGVVMTSRDISDRKQAEKALADSERQLRAIFDSALDGILIADDDGFYVDANPAACLMFGVPKEELIGRNIREFSDRDYDFKSKWQAFLAKGKVTAEFRLVRLDGSKRNLESFATANFLPNRHLSVLRDITERKQTEEALQRHKQILDLANDGIIILDLNYKITYWNQGAQRLYGWTKDEAIGKYAQTLWQTVFPQPLEEIENALWRQGSWEGELIQTKQDGTRITVASSWTLQRDEAGIPQAILEINNDITERKRSEEELRSSEERFRSLSACSPVGIFLTDMNGRCTYTNPRWQAICGLRLEETLGDGWAHAVHPGDRAWVFEEWSARAREGQEFSGEFRFQTKDGIVRWVRVRSSPLLSDDGQFIGHVGTVEDFTDRKVAEDSLRESEERFRQLAENINQVFWMISVDGSKMLYVSPGYEKIWGRTCNSLYEQPRSWMDSIHPEDRDRVSAAVLKRIEGSPYFNEEYRIVLPDGSLRWIWARSFPIRNELGEVYRVAGLAEDIGDRKRAEAEILNALTKERELSELKTRFVAMISHEFRTPLSTIISSADLLEYYIQECPTDKTEKKLEHLVRIQTAVVNLTGLLEDVLFLGRADSSRLPFQPAPFDLTSFCRELVEEMQICAKTHHTLTFVHKRPDEAETYASGSRTSESIVACLEQKLLRQLLNNLLSNAIKYSPEGGTIRFELSCHNDEVVFQIQDEGIGIPPEDFPRLFEAFHRAQNVGNLPGTGLGLAVVQHCVDLHGGRVAVSSEVGVGSTFTVTLPLSKCQV